MTLNKKTKGGVRRSQIITTYGVGAIVPLGSESFMVAGIDHWTTGRVDVHEPRLERQLHVTGFVRPPSGEHGDDVPIVRFPGIYSCPSCHRLQHHRFFARGAEHKCGACGVELLPSRFVMACEHGHIDDFPYFRWVHYGRASFAADDGDSEAGSSGATTESAVAPQTEEGDDGHSAGPRGSHELTIEATGISASLRDILIRCSCGRKRTMEFAFARGGLKGVSKCTGRRPWLGDSQACSETPRTLQRGASNVYFAVVRSAISIPPWSEGAFKALNDHWGTLKFVPEDDLPEALAGLRAAAGTDYTIADLVAAAKQRKGAEGSATPTGDDEQSLRKQEYEALLKGRPETAGKKQDFVAVSADDPGDDIAEWFDRVMLVTKLREVRALEAFTRLLPPSPADPKDPKDPQYRWSPLAQNATKWLPAIEVLGEGVFLRLALASLDVWETRPDVRTRIARINRNYARKFTDVKRVPDRVITAREVLLHTLAHVLINEWSLDSGYPAASLRERLYVAPDMAGLLIYTATTDSAGSLGGVIAQAAGGRLGMVLHHAIQRAGWCSADPLCLEAEAAGVDGLNLAACHACVLLPEVSCEQQNVLLDRALLVGTAENPSLGFFAALLEEV